MKNHLLKSERVKRNMTQEDMSEMLGLKTLQGYSMKENGQRSFSIEEIKIISEKWELTASEIKNIFL